MNHETRFLKFEHKGTSPSGKTDRWVVSSQTSAQTLGWIEWHAPWRRYWFCPMNQTSFDYECMQDIADFLKARMEERKAKL